jgi:tryptophan 2,3-dioxygenase
MSTRRYDKTERVDLTDEPIHWELGSSLSYGEYLQLDKLLDAQKPLTFQHDEMMFIIVHQTSELWMRLILHELTGVLECVRKDNLDPSFKMLARIARVQTQLTATWDVLSTMTPAEYSAFRNALGRSSGFQSVQYRLLEFMLGNKHPAMVDVHRRDPQAQAQLQQALEAPSLYDEVLRLRICCATSRSLTKRASRWPAHGSACITTPRRTGTSTSWPSASSTWTRNSSFGARTT